MKSLNLTFKSNNGKKHLLKLSYANDNLDAPTVRQAMAKIAEADIFVKGNEHLYMVPLSAKYVDTISSVIFNDEEKQTSEE